MTRGILVGIVLIICLLSFGIATPVSAANASFSAVLFNNFTFPTGNGFAVDLSNDSYYMAVAHATSPYVSIYYQNFTDMYNYTKLDNPATLPAGVGGGVAISNDTQYLAVGHTTTPFITIYYRNPSHISNWTKLPSNPLILPTGNGANVSFSPDGNYLAVAHTTAPYISVYYKNLSFNGNWTKLPNMTTLPTGNGIGVAFSNNSQFMAVSHMTSPYVSIYRYNSSDLSNWTKLTNPLTLPTGVGNGVAFSRNISFLAVGHVTSPYVTIYKYNASFIGNWTKLTNPVALPAGVGQGVGFSPNNSFLSVAHTTSPYVTIYRLNTSYASNFTKLPSNPLRLPSGVGAGVVFNTTNNTMIVAHTTFPYISIYDLNSTFNGNWTKREMSPAINFEDTARGIAFSSDNIFMAVTHAIAPYITVYKNDTTNGTAYTTMMRPSITPTGTAGGVAFSYDTNYMSVAHTTSPYVTNYIKDTYVFGYRWTKLTNPTTLPTGNGAGVAISIDGNYMAVAHTTAPYVTIYKKNDIVDPLTHWFNTSNPLTTPTGNGAGVAFSPDSNYMAVAHTTSPYVTIYYKNLTDKSNWTKLTNPLTPPTGNGAAVDFSADGNYMAVAHTTSPYVSVYYKNLSFSGNWTKLTNPASLPSTTGTAVAFSKDSSLMTVGFAGSPFTSVYQKNLSHASNWTRLPSSIVQRYQTNGIAFSYDSKYMGTAQTQSFAAVFALIAYPTAQFSSNVTNGTIYALPVKFTDASLGAPTTWNWSFGDGRFSEIQSPVYYYSVAGKYNVTLNITNAFGADSKLSTNHINLTSDSDSYLVSWLHMNGTEGSTDFRDEMGNNWIDSGDVDITTSTYQFGASSGDFTGSKTYIYTPSSSSFDFGTGDFAIEMWCNVSSSNNGMPLIKRGNSGLTSGWGVYHSSSSSTSNAWRFYMGSSAENTTGTFTLPLNTWTHLSVIRESGTVKVYVNGNQTTSLTDMGYNFDTSNPIYVGYQTPNKYYRGYIDEFRISNGKARWVTNFTTPWAEYRGLLESVYRDINVNSTLRYKTNPSSYATIANQTDGGTRNRTIQLEGVINASHLVGALVYDPLYTIPVSIALNTTTYSAGMSLVSSEIDSVNSTVKFNVTRTPGFNNGTVRAPIIDVKYLYYNYTDQPYTLTSFAYGYLINKTTNITYPVHNFIVTNMTCLPWEFTAEFSANTTEQQTGEPVIFNSTFTGAYPNRWNWSWGDGTFTNGEDNNITHTWYTSGLKTVSLTEYLWQNGSVNNTVTKVNYMNITGGVIPTPTPTPVPTSTPEYGNDNITSSQGNTTYTGEDFFVPFWLWAVLIFGGVGFLIASFWGSKIIFGMLSTMAFTASAFASPMVGMFTNEIVEVDANTSIVVPIVSSVTQPWVMWLLWGMATIAFIVFVWGILELFKELNEVDGDNWI